MKDRWESDFPTTGNGSYSFVSGRWALRTPHAGEATSGNIARPGMWRRRTRFWIGLRKAQSKQGRNKFFDTGWGETWGPACERVVADGRTDGQSLCHPAWPPRDPMDSWELLSLGQRWPGGDRLCPSRDMRKPVALTKSPAPLMREAQVRL